MGLTQKLGTIPLAILTDSSNNVGIGAAANASFKLQVTGATNLTGALSVGAANDGNGTLYVSALASTNAARLRNDNASFSTLDINNANASGTGVYSVASKNYFSGNVGIGVVTDTWRADIGNVRALQFDAGSIWGFRTTGTGDFNIGQNYYYGAAGTRYRLQTGAVSSYRQNDGSHTWQIAASGSAGTSFGFTDAMTLTNGGVVGIGVTPASQNSGAYAGSAEMAGILRIQGGGGRYFTSGDGMEISKTSIYSYNRSTGSYNNIGINDAMTIVGGGNVLIGTTTDYGYKTVVAGNNGLYVRGGSSTSDTPILIQDNGGGTIFKVRAGDAFLQAIGVYNNTVGSGANVVITSDGGLQRSTSSLKYKKDVENAWYGLSDVMKLRAVTYKGKNEKDGDLVFGGLIAEEVHEAGLTEFVQYADDGSPDALSYGNMVSLLVKAIQELNQKVNALENR
jgi:hypothetical protein